MFVGILLVALMVAFPPMRSSDRSFNGYGLFPGGCTYIAQMDRDRVVTVGPWQYTEKADTGWRCWRPNYQKLGFQLVIAGLVTVALFILLGKPK